LEYAGADAAKDARYMLRMSLFNIFIALTRFLPAPNAARSLFAILRAAIDIIAVLFTGTGVNLLLEEVGGILLCAAYNFFIKFPNKPVPAHTIRGIAYGSLESSLDFYSLKKIT
jgi:hypothetical protein